jgi:hypothetical protein
MHPGFHGWWRARHQGHDAFMHASCGHGGRHHHRGRHHDDHAHPCGAWAAPSFDEGGLLGVRRPLRYLAYKLELSEPQVAAFAAILDELKTERAQAAVDQRRRISALAEAVEGEAFDVERVQSASEEQQRSDARVRQAVAQALAKMHAALEDDQRKRLAYLLRTGALSM